MSNSSSAFINACDHFGIYFNDTDGSVTKNLNVCIYIDGSKQTKFNINTEVVFSRMSSDSKVTIDALEGRGVHWDVSARWQDFSFSEVTKTLSIKGKSPKHIYNHSYLIEISE